MNRRTAAIALFLLVLAVNADACTVCMGDPNSKMAEASNGVFITLLSLVGGIFTATGATIYYFSRRF